MVCKPHFPQFSFDNELLHVAQYNHPLARLAAPDGMTILLTLQSGRLWKPEKFQDWRHLAEEARMRSPLIVFLLGQILRASREMRREVFLFLRLDSHPAVSMANQERHE